VNTATDTKNQTVWDMFTRACSVMMNWYVNHPDIRPSLNSNKNHQWHWNKGVITISIVFHIYSIGQLIFVRKYCIHDWRTINHKWVEQCRLEWEFSPITDDIHMSLPSMALVTVWTWPKIRMIDIPIHNYWICSSKHILHCLIVGISCSIHCSVVSNIDKIFKKILKSVVFAKIVPKLHRLPK